MVWGEAASAELALLTRDQQLPASLEDIKQTRWSSPNLLCFFQTVKPITPLPLRRPFRSYPRPRLSTSAGWTTLAMLFSRNGSSTSLRLLSTLSLVGKRRALINSSPLLGLLTASVQEAVDWASSRLPRGNFKLWLSRKVGPKETETVSFTKPSVSWRWITLAS